MIMHFTCSLSVKYGMMKQGELVHALGHVTPNNIIGVMVQSEDHCNRVASYVEGVLQWKKVENRWQLEPQLQHKRCREIRV